MLDILALDILGLDILGMTLTIRSSVMIQTGDSLRDFDWLKCPDVQMFRGYYLQMFLLCTVIGYYLPRSWLSGGQVI